MIALVLRRGIEAVEELVSDVFAIPVSRASRRERSAELAAADELVAKVFGIPLEKVKGKKDPNSAKGFDALVLGLLRDLADDAAPVEKEAIKALSEKLDKDWPSMSKTEQGKAIDKAAAEWLGINRKIPVMNWPTYAAHGKSIVEQTKTATVIENGFRIVPSFDLADAKAVEASANMQALYTRDNYGKRSTVMSAEARKVVSAGIDEGLDRYEIGKNLEALYTAGGVASFQRSASYFRMIASVFTARARSWSNLSTYRDVGIETFRFEAVLDEVTTDVCRMMHGKTFSTSQALEGYTQVAASEDPEDVKTIQPWVQSGKNDQGEQILYYKNDKGTRVPIANVKESGVGKADAIGKYEGMGSKALQKAGISAPPLHAHCRSTIVPAGASVGTGVVPPKAPKPEPAAAAPASAPAPPAEELFPVTPTGELDALALLGGKKPDAYGVPKKPAPAPAPVVVPPIVQPPRPVVAGPAISTLPGELADPKAVVVWDGNAKHEGVALHGVPFKPVAKGFWDDHEEVDVGEPEIVAPPGKHVSAGMIIVEPDGRAWIVEPKGHYGNTKHTYPKGSRDPGESLQATALREVWEESGLEGNIVGHLGDFAGETSITRYYIATRKGGAPWAFGHESQAVKLVPIGNLEEFLNKDRDKKIAAALREKMAADPKMLSRVPPKAPEKPKPGKINKSDVILGEQIGPQTGSNPGGLYRGRDGVERYVKFYANREQAFSEHFANTLYRDIGQGAPETLIFEHNGQIGIASKIIPGKTFSKAGLTAERAKGFLDGFTADVLTANWDAVGTGQDNAYEGDDGKFYRIDNGGALLFRARGERKDSGVLGKIGEWKTFFEPGRDYAKVLKAAGVTKPADMIDQLRAGYAGIDKLRKEHGGWKGYVDKIAPFMGDDERRQVATMLEARADLIRDEIAKIEASLPKPSARYVERSWSNVTPRKGLTVRDLPEIDLEGKDKPKSYKSYAGSTGNLPSGEKRADYQERADKSVAVLSSSEKSAVRDFTGSDYGYIRSLEEDGNPDYRSDAIARGLARATPEPGTTWRGIKNVPEEVIRKFYLENDGTPFALGRNNTGATSSTAWDLNVAAKGMFGGGFENPSNGKYRIYFKINGKTGVPVETISSAGAGETEVLMSRNARFKLTGLARMKGHDRVLFVELEEVLPGESFDVIKPSGAVAKVPKQPKAPKVTTVKLPAHPNTVYGAENEAKWKEDVAAIEAATGIKTTATVYQLGDYDAWAEKIRAWNLAQKAPKPAKAPKINWPEPPKSKVPGPEFWNQVAAVEQASGVPYSGSYAKYADWKKDVAAAKKVAQQQANATAAATAAANKPIPKKIAGLPVPASKPPGGDADEKWLDQIEDIEQATGVKYNAAEQDFEDWAAEAAAAAKAKPKVGTNFKIPPSKSAVEAKGGDVEAWKKKVLAIEAKTGILIANFDSSLAYDQWKDELEAWQAKQPKAEAKPKKTKAPAGTMIAGVKLPSRSPNLAETMEENEKLHQDVKAIQAATGIKWGDKKYTEWKAEVEAWQAKQPGAAAKPAKARKVKIEIPPTMMDALNADMGVTEWSEWVASVEAKTGIEFTGDQGMNDDHAAWAKKVKAWEKEQNKPKAKTPEPAAAPAPWTPPKTIAGLPVPALESPSDPKEAKRWIEQVLAIQTKTGEPWTGGNLADWLKSAQENYESDQVDDVLAEITGVPTPKTKLPRTIAGLPVPASKPPSGSSDAAWTKFQNQVSDVWRATGVSASDFDTHEEWIKAASEAAKKPKPKAPPPAAPPAVGAPKPPTMIGSFLVPTEPDPKLSANNPAWNKYDADTAAISTAYGVAPWHHFKTHDEWVAAVVEAAAKVKK